MPHQVRETVHGVWRKDDVDLWFDCLMCSWHGRAVCVWSRKTEPKYVKNTLGTDDRHVLVRSYWVPSPSHR